MKKTKLKIPSRDNSIRTLTATQSNDVIAKGLIISSQRRSEGTQKFKKVMPNSSKAKIENLALIKNNLIKTEKEPIKLEPIV